MTVGSGSGLTDLDGMERSHFPERGQDKGLLPLPNGECTRVKGLVPCGLVGQSPAPSESPAFDTKCQKSYGVTFVKVKKAWGFPPHTPDERATLDPDTLAVRQRETAFCCSPLGKVSFRVTPSRDAP